MYIKHSKYKNTGLLFEILVKRITSDTLSGGESKAISILKKYFVNTELGKEYKLYETAFKQKSISEGKANTILDTIIEASKKLNRTKLKREKYNLIKELKNYYDVDELFRTKISNYKALASLYTLFEIYGTDLPTDPNQIIDNKVTLLEHLTQGEILREGIKEDIIEEFKGYDKDLRTLTYRIMLEKFNEKYADLNTKQKNILKEFIESVDSTPKLKEFYNQEIQIIKTSLKAQIQEVKDEAIRIKLEEVSKYIKELDKKCNITSDHLVDLLQYHSLIEELSNTHA